MSVTLTTHSVAGGLLTIDASVASPANYKILRYWIMCSNGHYADECMPTYERWSGGQLTMTTARRLSLIDLSLFPNGPLEFVLNCQHKSLLNSTVVTDETVTISVNNTWNVAPKSSSAYSYPEGAIQSPVTLTFDATSTIGIFDIPIALSAVDNVAVSAYLISENSTTPAASDPRWTPAAPTSYAVAQSGTYTLYAWAKDADGNISDRVSTTATVYVPTVTVSPVPGTYSTAQTVTLTRANFTGGTIYYTLDGSDPTTASAVYSAPITVTESTTLKVLPVDADGNQGAVQTFAYVVRAPLFFTAQPTLLTPADGGGVVTYGTADADAEEATSTADVTATATSAAVFREAASALIAAGVSASDTRQMIEAVMATANVSVVANSTLQSVERALAWIEAFPTVADLLTLADKVIQPFIFTAQPTLSMQTGDGGIVTYGTADTGADDVTSSADVTAQVTDLLTKVEALLTTVQAVPSVADLMAQVEAIATTAQAEAIAIDVKISGVADNLVTAASGISEVSDMQLLVDNLTIMAQSGASLVEINDYLDMVTSTAAAGISVTDTLLGPFIGTYIFRDLCRPRTFWNQAEPRTFINYCSPRGRA